MPTTVDMSRSFAGAVAPCLPIVQLYTVDRRCGSPNVRLYHRRSLDRPEDKSGRFTMAYRHAADCVPWKALLVDSGEPAQPVRVTGPAAGGQKEVPGVPDKPSQAADSPERWRQVRAMLTSNRPELSPVAAGLYPGPLRVRSTDLLSRAEWLPDVPLSLDDLPLAWGEQPPSPALDLTGPVSGHVPPVREGGRGFAGC